MRQSDRVRLYFGPYRTPRFKVGQEIQCAIRGKVTIYGVSKGRIPWPLYRTAIRPSLVLYAGLAKAVRQESVDAVCYWWGVSRGPVKVWRRSLGVPLHKIAAAPPIARVSGPERSRERFSTRILAN